MNKLKVYIGSLPYKKPILEFLPRDMQDIPKENMFGEKNIFDTDFEYVEVVQGPEQSEYFLLPYSYNHVSKEKSYLDNFDKLANKYNKRVIVFLLGDSNEDIEISNSIVFRMSKYKTNINKNEIIMPAYSADLGSLYGISYREKGEDKPIVGFCGWANIPDIDKKIKYKIKEFVWNVVGLFVKKYKARIPGVILRENIISIIEKSKLVRNNFIIRKSYSGNTKTISLDPKIARGEYIKSIKDSDYYLCPKGDGNFSVRFFECLSLGRIPVIINTDMDLPFSDIIDYKDFIIKIEMDDVGVIDKIISDHYIRINNTDFINIQKKCRNVFDQYLNIHVFFMNVLKNEFLDKVPKV